MHVFISLIEAMSVFLVVSYLYCSSPALPGRPLDRLPGRSRLSLYLFFSGVSIMGTYLGIPVQGGEAIANTRAVGSILAGLLGGPSLGLATGLTAGVQRLSLGGNAAIAGCVATSLEGLLAGAVHLWLRDRPDRLMNWRTAAVVTLSGEVAHQGIVLLLVEPWPQALAIVRDIAPAMIVANTLGAALFMVVFQNRLELLDRVGAASSALALRIAERSVGLMTKGYGKEVAGELATIVREETGVAAVGITDHEKVLAWSGMGADHHVPGTDITSPWTRRALASKQVAYADGVRDFYACRVTGACPLTSVVVVPLQMDGNVVGTVQLFEATQRFRTTNRRLGEGIAALLSSQLVLARYQEQKTLLVTSELKLLQAQVDPHFLFNALNTIMSITRSDPERARELLLHLSKFFRKNLKRRSDVSTLEEELQHVRSYLEIERARFPDRLTFDTDVDAALLGIRMPTFTLQPLVENAIKHGISRSPNPGRTTIRAYRQDGAVRIDVEDDAGAYVQRDWRKTGLGMKIVDKRIKNLLGDDYGITVHCVPQELTRITVTLPPEGLQA